MLVIPAVDIKRGKCVRLRQGDLSQETVYGEDPLEIALRWEREGAGRLHVVDLDGAVEGKSVNAPSIRRILSGVTIPVQVGGGIRSMESVEGYFEAGACGIILGTSVVLDRSFADEACRKFPGKMIGGIDTREGRIAVRGWTALVEEPLEGVLKKMAEVGFASVVLTDIGRDGMLQGPNLSFYREIAPKSPLPVIASGGVTRLEDLRGLAGIPKIHGVIVGKALYAGTLSLPEAMAVLKGGSC
jgi:phosphoribosylformimino-5-aminoimidazole carboxamide ribotide isomerase